MSPYSKWSQIGLHINYDRFFVSLELFKKLGIFELEENATQRFNEADLLYVHWKSEMLVYLQ